ncbi:rolling circle replication-associated protein [Hydrogenophaga sp. NFH-34]|uniref:rolling circle replication-associated protein n=1 Tax=Hydrogenophaga sp. NFH-34 TaxID=2744446 RepID=UPI001F32BD62|nr:hypothetical protein [Hydrogenophaga sp. NFH-34]
MTPQAYDDWSAHQARLDVLAAMSAEKAAVGATAHARSAGSVASEGAGLVSSKTSLPDLFVNLSPSAVAERRVKRLKRSVWASGHLHAMADRGHRPPVCWFVTLTYRGVDDWQADHISKAIQGYRNWCRDNRIPCRYTWVAELQGRGAVHYHLLCWLPRGFSMPHWDRAKGRRAKWWPHGMTNTQKAKAGVGYLMKYLSKLGEQTRFPKGLRLYGIGGLNKEGRAIRSWLNLPEWVKASHGVGDVKRLSSGFVVLRTGEVLEPAYRVQQVPSGFLLCRLRELPSRFHSGPYSTLH